METFKFIVPIAAHFVSLIAACMAIGAWQNQEKLDALYLIGWAIFVKMITL